MEEWLEMVMEMERRKVMVMEMERRKVMVLMRVVGVMEMVMVLESVESWREGKGRKTRRW